MRLLPSDRDIYETEPHPYYPGERMLAHKPNGECVYLGEKGCNIHAFAPSQCRTMDCRIVFRKLNFVQAIGMTREGKLNLEVWRKGRELTKSSRRRGKRNG